MRAVETRQAFPLSSVKPLDEVREHRDYCLDLVREALDRAPTRRRERSPVSGAQLESLGDVAGLEYVVCPDSGSLFLATVPPTPVWGEVLRQVTAYRRSAMTSHPQLARARVETVLAPKLEWLRNTLLLQGLDSPRLLEVTTLPSEFSAFLASTGAFDDVTVLDETELLTFGDRGGSPGARAPENHGTVAVLIESLDRVDDPLGLLQAVASTLDEGDLILVTALVASGFDATVLGLRNFYLYPPDRTNCFSVAGLEALLRRTGFDLLEVSTPGVLDVEVVEAHLQHDPTIPLSAFERQIVESDSQAREGFQTFLQQQRMSSFARVVGRRTA